MPRPYLQFYPRDWRSDAALQACSLAARGVWIEMMTFMHQAEPYGYLVIGDQRFGAGADDATDLALKIGVRVPDLRRAIDELVRNRVCSLDADGTIFSRRMVRDEERRLRSIENGRLGGSPTLTRGLTPGVKAPHKAHARERDRDPDTRDQSTATPSGTRVREVRPLTEPFGMADWIWGAAFERGLIGEHRAPDRDEDVRRDLAAAKRLLDAYPVAEIQTRAHRFLAALHSGEIKKATPTASSLARLWDFACVAPPREPAPANGNTKRKFLDVAALD